MLNGRYGVDIGQRCDVKMPEIRSARANKDDRQRAKSSGPGPGGDGGSSDDARALYSAAEVFLAIRQRSLLDKSLTGYQTN